MRISICGGLGFLEVINEEVIGAMGGKKGELGG